MMRWLAFLLFAMSPAVAFTPPSVQVMDVPDNATLQATATTAFPQGVYRSDFAVGNGAPPLFYRPSSTACSIASGAGDNGSQVKSADGKCWLAQFPASGIDPRQFGAANNGVTADDAAWSSTVAAAQSIGSTIACSGSYGITGPLVFVGTASNQLRISGPCQFIGVASTATAALLEIGGAVTLDGQVKANCNFNYNYSRGIWVGYNGSQTQFDFLDNAATSGCLVGFNVGNALFPGAIVSEMTIKGGYTYGSPIALRVEGANTYLAVTGAQLTSDLGGAWYSTTSTTSLTLGTGSQSLTVGTGLTIPTGTPIEIRLQLASFAQDYMLGTVTSYNSGTGALVVNVTAVNGSGFGSTWLVTPPMAGLQVIGAFVNLSGGQLQMPGSAGRLINIQPLELTLGNHQAQYGRVYLSNVMSEVQNVFADTLNPSNLTIAGNVTGVLSSINSYGFVSKNIAPFINTDATFVGSINVAGAAWFAPGARSQLNISAVAGSKTTVTVDAGGFGVNFENNYFGIGNATVLPIQSLGAPPTNTGTCTITNQAGGNTGGVFVLNAACASGTIILNFATTMPNGYVCAASDNGTAAATFRQTTYSVKTCTLTVTGAANGDFVTFNAQGF